MTLFDVIIVVAALAAAMGGYRLGFLARVTSWIGLALGVYLGARFLPRIINAASLANPVSRLLVAVLILISGAFVGQAVGLIVGARLHRALPLGPVREVDRGIGAGIGALGILIALWLLLPSMAVVPGWPARAARTSTISQWVDSNFPRPPDALQELRRLVGPDVFPQVFSALHPGEDLGPPPASSGLSATVLTRVSGATVKVEGEACSRIQDGSGFAVAPDTIVTNAHVVAGEARDRTRVVLLSGAQLPATVVMFDPERDLAVLSVPHLGENPLPVGTGSVGMTGAVFGHPGGQDALAVAPAAIRQNVKAVGRDLYDSREISRDVFILAADLHPGDSGGPLVDQAGAVVGVAFAIAPDRPGTAYALTSKELDAALASPRATAAATGPCLAS
ncbi:MAG TPA: MarP family serine protease [Acidimicrobiales bacterium]|nr:MarP family serine protease [Acidimicrobiales bacterium]